MSSLRCERPEPTQGQSRTWSLIPKGLATPPWPEACGIPAPPPCGSGARAYTSPGTGDSVCIPESLPECLGGSPHGWHPPQGTGFSRLCSQVDPVGHLPQLPPSPEVPHVRPPTPGRAHNRPHQQPCSRHPALEKRQCECTSKWPPAAQTPAPPPLKQPTGGLLPLPRRLAIARISQLSLEPLKSCDVFLEGFLTPDESWETTRVPGAPVTTLLPGSHFALQTPGPLSAWSQTSATSWSSCPWDGQGLWGLLGGFSCRSECSPGKSPGGVSCRSECSPGKSPRTGRLDSIGAQCLLPGPASLAEVAGPSPGMVVSPMGFPEWVLCSLSL